MTKFKKKTEEMNKEKMKKMLENLPRFDFKKICFFKEKKDMQKAVDSLCNNGIMNLNSRTLTNNYIEELYEMFIFIPREGRYALQSGIIGGITGGIIGWLQGNTYVSFPVLNPVSAGGAAVSTILGAGAGAIICSSIFSTIMLFKPVNNIRPGYNMLTIYSDAENKKQIKKLLEGIEYEDKI